MRTWLLTVFAATSLALTCLGIYGTLSYVVSLRRREVALRIALGAVSGAIVTQFLGKALRVVGIACSVGLALSYVFARTLAGMLYGVAPSDPVTLITVVVLVGTVAGALPFSQRSERPASSRWWCYETIESADIARDPIAVRTPDVHGTLS